MRPVILEQSLAGSPLFQIAWQRLQSLFAIVFVSITLIFRRAVLYNQTKTDRPRGTKIYPIYVCSWMTNQYVPRGEWCSTVLTSHQLPPVPSARSNVQMRLILTLLLNLGSSTTNHVPTKDKLTGRVGIELITKNIKPHDDYKQTRLINLAPSGGEFYQVLAGLPRISAERNWESALFR